MLTQRLTRRINTRGHDGSGLTSANSRFNMITCATIFNLRLNQFWVGSERDKSGCRSSDFEDIQQVISTGWW